MSESTLAVRVGFEPTEPVKVQRFSRPPDSTALAPHRTLNLADFTATCNSDNNKHTSAGEQLGHQVNKGSGSQAAILARFLFLARRRHDVLHSKIHGHVSIFFIGMRHNGRHEQAGLAVVLALW